MGAVAGRACRPSHYRAPLARAIAAIGTDQHVEWLIDLIRELVPQDLVTVTRYSTTQHAGIR